MLIIMFVLIYVYFLIFLKCLLFATIKKKRKRWKLNYVLDKQSFLSVNIQSADKFIFEYVT